MTGRFNIAGYARISVDEELDRDNTSIENQKAIIKDFVKHRFPESVLEFYEDRDKSGYTFDQRPGYQSMRRELMKHRKDILIVKDFSRFSRRNSRGLVELEDLRDAGVRIISIGDNIDFPNDDDWLKIQFQFLINEMPVTDTSKKVRSVVRRRQQDGNWLCAAPYGYIINRQRQFEIVPEEAEVVRRIYDLYNDGWGYKRIANWLTDHGIATPRMSERERKEAAGEEYRRAVKTEWSVVTVQGILDNDFYIGTLRQGKYARAKINGKNVRRDENEHIVIENHHVPVIDYRTFAITKALREKRGVTHYRGVRRYDNVYSGFLFCGDCGAPMFAMSRPDLREAYRCGTYHRRGLKGCTSHHIRADRLNEMLKVYLKKVRDNSADMLEKLNEDIKKEAHNIEETETGAVKLEEMMNGLQEELKATKRQRVRDIIKHPEQESILEETYGALENELINRIEGVKNQLQMSLDKRNTIINVNRAAKTAMEVFDGILDKEKFERGDLELIVDKIKVFEDHVDIYLKADIDSLIRCGELPYSIEITQSADRHGSKIFSVRIVSDGDPLEIFTDRDGEVIFKKYSPMGEMGALASELAESLSRTVGMSCAICDRDAVIAASGSAKKDILEKRISPELESIMEQRNLYERESGETQEINVSERDMYTVTTAAPIITDGDVTGCVVFVSEDDSATADEVQVKLCQTASQFLSRRVAM